ncbi:MAG: FeoA family protein [Pseudomonadota bacterium]
MSEAVVLDIPLARPVPQAGQARLSDGAVGARGVIVRVNPRGGALAADELERRLLELGFVEGARVEILHEGLFGRDPIAVRLDDMRVALRRREAAAVDVVFDGPGAGA